MKQMSHGLRSRCNPVYKTANRKITLYGIITEMILFCVICICIINIKDHFLKYVVALGLFGVIHLPLRILTGKYWRCPGCGAKLPRCLYFPEYVEKCPRCNFNLIDEKRLPTDEEILEDNMRRKKIVYICIIITLATILFGLLFLLVGIS